MPNPGLIRLSASLFASALFVATLWSAPAYAQRGGRSSMEGCVARVLTRLARARAPERQVGPAVVASCDRPLRASLAAAIRSGEAAMCTVESCISMARQRAAEEATASYRQRFRR
jgi:hypothetical protein